MYMCTYSVLTNVTHVDICDQNNARLLIPPLHICKIFFSFHFFSYGQIVQKCHFSSKFGAFICFVCKIPFPGHFLSPSLSPLKLKHLLIISLSLSFFLIILSFLQSLPVIVATVQSCCVWADCCYGCCCYCLSRRRRCLLSSIVQCFI